MLEVIWCVSTRLRKWFIPFGGHSYRGTGRVASIAENSKNGNSSQGSHGGEATGSYFCHSPGWPCAHKMEREMPIGRGKKADEECNSFLRAGIGLLDCYTDTLK